MCLRASAQKWSAGTSICGRLSGTGRDLRWADRLSRGRYLPLLPEPSVRCRPSVGHSARGTPNVRFWRHVAKSCRSAHGPETSGLQSALNSVVDLYRRDPEADMREVDRGTTLATRIQVATPTPLSSETISPTHTVASSGSSERTSRPCGIVVVQQRSLGRRLDEQQTPLLRPRHR